MRLWPFGRKPEPPQRDQRTPIANAVEDMSVAGFSMDAILLTIRTSELNAFRAVRTYALDMQASAMSVQQTAHPVHTSAKVSTKAADTKPRNQRNHQRKRSRGPKKRNRANYMRTYRRKLRLVTNDGDAA
jgi:hypothetical protein